jgi:uncharacterized cupin superfamily protein
MMKADISVSALIIQRWLTGGGSMASPNSVNLADVPPEPIKGPDGSAFGGSRQRVGVRIGAHKLGYSFFSVPPGMAAFPYHAHTGNEEMIYVLAGEGVLRLGTEQSDVRAGAVIACPAGGEFAHQLINTGAGELRYLVVSTMEYPDITEYPDSKKIGAYATAAVGSRIGLRALYPRDTSMRYYDGEDGAEIARILEERSRG